MSFRFRCLACLAALIAIVSPQPGRAAQISPQPRSTADAVDRMLARRAQDAAALERARQIPSPTPLGSRSLRRRAIRLQPGDMLSPSSKRSSTLRLQVSDDGVKIKRHKLGETFVPRAVDYESTNSWIAIAAVTQVLLVEAASGTATVIDRPGELAESFGYVNDVLFVDDNRLLIADIGPQTEGKVPDGRLWLYELAEATWAEAGTSGVLANPRELAQSEEGTIYLIDGEAGQQIAPNIDFFYDVVYRLAGNNLLNLQTVFSGAGVQATAFDVGPNGRLWIANLAELAFLDAGVLTFPCAVPFPFQFVTSLVATGASEAYLIDGAGSPPGRSLYRVDNACRPTFVSSQAKLKEARGLVQVPESQSRP